MYRQPFFLLVFICVFPFLAISQGSEGGIKSMDWLVGKWSVSTKEEDSDGSFFKESGFNQCEYASKDRMIRCEISLITEETGGRYVDGWKSRVIIYYISYNRDEDHFVMRLIFPNRTITHDFKAKTPTLYEGRWLNKGQAIGGDMDMVFQYEIVDKDNFRHTEHLTSRISDFTENYVMINRRIK